VGSLYHTKGSASTSSSVAAARVAAARSPRRARRPIVIDDVDATTTRSNASTRRTKRGDTAARATTRDRDATTETRPPADDVMRTEWTPATRDAILSRGRTPRWTERCARVRSRSTLARRRRVAATARDDVSRIPRTHHLITPPRHRDADRRARSRGRANVRLERARALSLRAHPSRARPSRRRAVREIAVEIPTRV